jgi:hypothetical protein
VTAFPDLPKAFPADSKRHGYLTAGAGRLIRSSRGNWLPEMVIVEDRIEDQAITSDGLSAMNGIVCEQQNIAISEMCVDHNRALRNRAALSSSPESSRVFRSLNRKITSHPSKKNTQLSAQNIAPPGYQTAPPSS